MDFLEQFEFLKSNCGGEGVQTQKLGKIPTLLVRLNLVNPKMESLLFVRLQLQNNKYNFPVRLDSAQLTKGCCHCVMEQERSSVR